jgi:hypothetical protein
MDVARIGVHRRRYCKANAARSQEVCENGLGLAQSHEQSRRSGVRRLVLLDRATSQQLPSLFGELEKCQKSLEGYLEQKRKKFPRFCFVSNPLLLLILFRGSDPAAVQQYYEKIFDSIVHVVHERPMSATADTKSSSAAATAANPSAKRNIVEIKSLVRWWATMKKRFRWYNPCS